MITPERLNEFVALVKQVRTAQKQYRRTIDSKLRHQLPPMEERLDREAEHLTEDLAGSESALAFPRSRFNASDWAERFRAARAGAAREPVTDDLLRVFGELLDVLAGVALTPDDFFQRPYLVLAVTAAGEVLSPRVKGGAA